MFIVFFNSHHTKPVFCWGVLLYENLQKSHSWYLYGQQGMSHEKKQGPYSWGERFLFFHSLKVVKYKSNRNASALLTNPFFWNFDWNGKGEQLFSLWYSVLSNQTCDMVTQT